MSDPEIEAWERAKADVDQHATYLHYKGGRYVIVCVALTESSLEPVVIYREFGDSKGLTWVRTLADFTASITLPDGTRVSRFRPEENEHE